MKSHSGSVLTEFVIVVGFVLLPLTLLVPVMYKYIENRQMVEQAARYSVWERVAYFGSAPGGSVDDAPEKSDETIALEIEGRILSHSKSRITTKSDSGQNSEPLNPVLRVRTGIDGELTPIYEEAEEDNEGQSAMYVSVSTAEHGLAGFGSLQSAFGKVLDLSDGFNPNLKGVYESSVSVSLKYLEWFEDSFAEGFSADEALSMSRTNALMTEGWSVGGPTHAKSTVGGLVPTTLFDEIGAESLFSVFSKLPLVKEVSFLNFGKVEPDAVPCARLGEVYNDTELRTPESCMSRLTPQLESYGHTYQE